MHGHLDCPSLAHDMVEPAAASMEHAPPIADVLPEWGEGVPGEDAQLLQQGQRGDQLVCTPQQAENDFVRKASACARIWHEQARHRVDNL